MFERTDVVARRSHPDLAALFDRALRSGAIEAVLPGVYARTHHKAFPEVRVKALRQYEPKAVITEAAAARLTFWPELEVGDVVAAVPRKLVAPAGFRFVRRTVPEHLVLDVDGSRVTVPALTAVDLGADAIDRALLHNAATLDQMREALAAIRWQPGNAARRLVLEESSDEPWSAAERRLHRLLRQAGIDGWRANVEMMVGGSSYPPDIVFADHRLVLEVDGKHFHGEGRFEYDRWRQNALVLDGWRVLRFTWTMIDEHPERVVETVRTALRTRPPTGP